MPFQAHLVHVGAGHILIVGQIHCFPPTATGDVREGTSTSSPHQDSAVQI